MTKPSSPILISPLALLLLTPACHESVDITENPTTAGSPEEFEEEGLACVGARRGPEEWIYHGCVGEVGGYLRFEYHGDPGLAVDTVLPCVPSLPEQKGPTYLYDCWAHMSALEFAPGLGGDYIEEVGVCCAEDAAHEQADEACAEATATELCRGNVALLDELRRLLPHVGKAGELYDQLTALNKYIAEAAPLAACSEALTAGLAEATTASWLPPDSPTEWPWIRNLRVVSDHYSIKQTENTGTTCGDYAPQGGGSLWECEIMGSLAIAGDGPLHGAAEGRVSGRIHLREGACADGQRCPLELDSLELRALALQPVPRGLAGAGDPALDSAAGSVALSAVGSPAWALSEAARSQAAGPDNTAAQARFLALAGGLADLRVALQSPARGELGPNGRLRLPGSAIVLEAAASLTPDHGKPERWQGDLRLDGPLLGDFNRDTGALRLAPATARSWPIAAELRDVQGLCEPAEPGGPQG